MSLGNIDAILDQLERLLRSQDGRSLPDAQRAVLYGLLTQPASRYEQLAAELKKMGFGSYKPQTLKNDAYKLFQRLTIALQSDVKIKKSNLRRSVLAWHNQQGTVGAVEKSSIPATPDGQTPGNLLSLHCWQDDLTRLTRQVIEGRRIVGISGPPRIGKTYFTYGLCDRLQATFEAPPIRCMAAHVSTPEELYGFVMRQLGEVPSQGPAIPALTELFRTRRLILVIDGTEALYEPGLWAGHFIKAASGYEMLLQQLLETPIHQSCLLWVGREPPACFGYPHGVLALHRMSPLGDQDAVALLNAWHTPLESANERSQLLKFCGGNPAWLLMAMTRAQQLYKGNVTAFLSSPSLPEDVMVILGNTLERLSNPERTLLIWLFLQPLSPEQLLHFSLPGTALDNQREALFSLERRGLIRQMSHDHPYEVNPPLFCHSLARWMVTHAETELTTGALCHLCHYPLLPTAAPAHRQHWQQQQVLKPIAQRLQRHFAFRKEQLACIQKCLDSIRHLPPQQQGYGAGNLLNLATALNLPLAELNFDGLEIWHADLRNANWHHARLSNCTFQNVLLPTHLSDRLVAAISPDGRMIAAGDQQGNGLYWHRDHGSIQLQQIWKMPCGIAAILCPENDTLLLLSNQEIYIGWTDEEFQPQRLFELPEPASCMAHSSLGHVAVGLANGQILLWDGSQHSLKTLNAHLSEVCNLVFSSDGLQLASLDQDNHVLLWDLSTTREGSPTWQEQPTRSAVCIAISWHNSTLLRAEVSGNELRLWLGDSDFKVRTIPDEDEWVIALYFSADGRCLVGRTSGDRLFHWAWEQDIFTVLAANAVSPGNLAITADGQWLLLTSAHQLQLLDTETWMCFWQSRVTEGDWSTAHFTDVAGLSPVEIALLKSLRLSITNRQNS